MGGVTSDINQTSCCLITILTYHCLTQLVDLRHNVHIFSVIISAPDAGFNLTISDIVNDPAMSDIQLLPRLAKEMIQVIHDLHQADLVILNLSTSNVYVRNWPKVIKFPVVVCWHFSHEA